MMNLETVELVCSWELRLGVGELEIRCDVIVIPALAPKICKGDGPGRNGNCDLESGCTESGRTLEEWKPAYGYLGRNQPAQPSIKLNVRAFITVLGTDSSHPPTSSSSASSSSSRTLEEKARKPSVTVGSFVYF